MFYILLSAYTDTLDYYSSLVKVILVKYENLMKTAVVTALAARQVAPHPNLSLLVNNYDSPVSTQR
jgi:hypothetical protein